jgi:hypothetical protein
VRHNLGNRKHMLATIGVLALQRHAYALDKIPIKGEPHIMWQRTLSADPTTVVDAGDSHIAFVRHDGTLVVLDVTGMQTESYPEPTLLDRALERGSTRSRQRLITNSLGAHVHAVGRTLRILCGPRARCNGTRTLALPSEISAIEAYLGGSVFAATEARIYRISGAGEVVGEIVAEHATLRAAGDDLWYASIHDGLTHLVKWTPAGGSNWVNKLPGLFVLTGAGPKQIALTQVLDTEAAIWEPSTATWLRTSGALAGEPHWVSGRAGAFLCPYVQDAPAATLAAAPAPVPARPMRGLPAAPPAPVSKKLIEFRRCDNNTPMFKLESTSSQVVWDTDDEGGIWAAGSSLDYVGSQGTSKSIGSVLCEGGAAPVKLVVSSGAVTYACQEGRIVRITGTTP